MLVRLAPDLALHVLEEAEGPLPVAASGELLEDEGEVGEGELVLEYVEAPRDAAPRREAAELVDQGLDVVAVLAFLHGDRGVPEDEVLRLRVDSRDGGARESSPAPAGEEAEAVAGGGGESAGSDEAEEGEVV